MALGDEGFLRRDHAQNHLYTGEYGVDFEATLGEPFRHQRRIVRVIVPWAGKGSV